jgi:UDP-N-acetylmuramoylalanine--D-glutamate ligase
MSFARWRSSGREAVVVGLGRSGTAAALLLRREGLRVYASDAAKDLGKLLGAEAALWLRRLQEAGVEVQVGGHDLQRIGHAGVCVISPGVPPTAPPLVAARDAGVPVVSELDVGYAALPGVRFAVITGTNGKTTTTALTGHLLETAGFKAVTAGNIGTPLAQLALEGKRPEWVALEASSFQLHDTYDLVPAIGAMTNLAPDHLDRYSSLEEYYADKDRLYRNANITSCWVLNGDDAEVERRAEGRRGDRLRFRIGTRAEGWYDGASRQLKLGDAPLLERGEFPLLGEHNVANALCAALITQRAGGEPAAIASGLTTFKALAHRMEPVGEVNRVLWINDSKATNVASTLVAVQAMERPFVLLLGGRHKGEPYTALAEPAQTLCRGVIAFGESRDIVVKDLEGRLPVVKKGSDFGEVLAAAAELVRPGDAVLLSPACSSYDMFKNYEDRGAQFRAAVERMR